MSTGSKKALAWLETLAIFSCACNNKFNTRCVFSTRSEKKACASLFCTGKNSSKLVEVKKLLGVLRPLRKHLRVGTTVPSPFVWKVLILWQKWTHILSWNRINASPGQGSGSCSELSSSSKVSVP